DSVLHQQTPLHSEFFKSQRIAPDGSNKDFSVHPRIPCLRGPVRQTDLLSFLRQATFYVKLLSYTCKKVLIPL
ncbi:MAG: hypothetical protein PUE14_07840, partial [Clostridia bacterium]|nr:hypothetical protein [Clostridia bacterium]